MNKQYYSLIILILFIFSGCAKTPQDLACEALELTYQALKSPDKDNIKKLEKIGKQMDNLSQNDLIEYLTIMEAEKCPKCNKNYKNRY